MKTIENVSNQHLRFIKQRSTANLSATTKEPFLTATASHKLIMMNRRLTNGPCEITRDLSPNRKFGQTLAPSSARRPLT